MFCCEQATIDTISAELPIWNLSAIAEHFLGLVLKRRAELHRSLQRTKLDRDAFRRDLLEVPGVRTVHPSGGNFMLVELDGATDTANVLRRRLLTDELIEIKDVTPRFADGVPRVRLAVRRPSDHQRLLAALARCLQVTPDLSTR